MSIKKPTLEERLQALRDNYGEQLPSKLSDVNSLWASLNTENWDWNIAKDFHRHIHTLAGSAPTFGFVEVGQHARKIEHICKLWLSDNKQPSAEECDHVTSMLKALFAIKQNDVDLPVPTNAGAPDWVNRKPDTHLIYLIDNDQDFARDVSSQLSHFDYHVKIFGGSADIDKSMKEERPSAIIVNVSLPEGDLAGILLIRGIKAQYSANLPVIFISKHDNFESRLQAVRAGGDAYFTKPLEIGPLIDHLDLLTKNTETEAFRVLIIDDDETLATHYSLVLEKAGMETSIVTDPKKVISALSGLRPELILMDIYMPLCSGLELAKLIRQQDAYVGIPIVFLSTETNLEKQFQAMRMGGDDFLTKPISDNRLVDSATIRADRARTLNTLMSQDSLTGLLEHSGIKEQLAIELSRSNRTNTPLSFAMINIDHFKKFNDNYGHLTGDRVIKSLARLLQQRLRQSDSIGRYGGEEFAVVLPGSTLEHAQAIFEEIRKSFAELHFLHEGDEVRASISIGISDAGLHTKAESINHAANEALYAAKVIGRNCVKLASSNAQKTR